MAILEEDLMVALKTWGDALILISKDYEASGIDQARHTASEILDNAYGFDLGPVLFKPTLSGGEKTFRTTKKGALSYFVGHNSDYPLDNGFGIQGWREVTLETAAHFIQGEVAMWTGRVNMTDKNGEMTVVDKSFGYKKGPDGSLKIVLHHSSLAICPEHAERV